MCLWMKKLNDTSLVFSQGHELCICSWTEQEFVFKHEAKKDALPNFRVFPSTFYSAPSRKFTRPKSCRKSDSKCWRAGGWSESDCRLFMVGRAGIGRRHSGATSITSKVRAMIKRHNNEWLTIRQSDDGDDDNLTFAECLPCIRHQSALTHLGLTPTRWVRCHYQCHLTNEKT